MEPDDPDTIEGVEFDSMECLCPEPTEDEVSTIAGSLTFDDLDSGWDEPDYPEFDW